MQTVGENLDKRGFTGFGGTGNNQREVEKVEVKSAQFKITTYEVKVYLGRK